MMKRLANAAALALGPMLGAVSAFAGVMIGAHVGKEGDPRTKADFVALESAIGRKLAIDNDHEVWAAFPDTDRVRWDVQNGRLPMLSWRIGLSRDNSAVGCATGDAIVAGTYDAQLARQAAAAKALGAPVLVRFNYEMTGKKRTHLLHRV
jgi:hypothetical protein